MAKMAFEVPGGHVALFSWPKWRSKPPTAMFCLVFMAKTTFKAFGGHVLTGFHGQNGVRSPRRPRFARFSWPKRRSKPMMATFCLVFMAKTTFKAFGGHVLPCFHGQNGVRSPRRPCFDRFSWPKRRSKPLTAMFGSGFLAGKPRAPSVLAWPGLVRTGRGFPSRGSGRRGSAAVRLCGLMLPAAVRPGGQTKIFSHGRCAPSFSLHRPGVFCPGALHRPGENFFSRVPRSFFPLAREDRPARKIFCPALFRLRRCDRRSLPCKK